MLSRSVWRIYYSNRYVKRGIVHVLFNPHLFGLVTGGNGQCGGTCRFGGVVCNGYGYYSVSVTGCGLNGAPFPVGDYGPCGVRDNSKRMFPRSVWRIDCRNGNIKCGIVDVLFDLHLFVLVTGGNSQHGGARRSGIVFGNGYGYLSVFVTGCGLNGTPFLVGGYCP